MKSIRRRGLKKLDETISRQLESLEERTLLTAFIIDSLSLAATPGIGITVNNADIIGTGSQASPEFDSLIIDTVTTNSAGITINLDNIALGSIVIESANLIDFDGTGIDINLDTVTGLRTVVVESTDAHGINSAAVDVNLLNTSVTNLTVFDSRLDGVQVRADNSVIERGRVISNAITAGVGVDAVLLDLKNGAVADGFTIQDNTQISSITEDSILLNFDGTPVDGLRIEDNTFATGSILDLDFLIDGDTFKQPFKITNKSAAGNLLEKFTFDIAPSGLEFDIDPITGKPFAPAPGGTDITTGFVPPAVVADRGTQLEIDFTDFDPGEFFEFDVDLDIAGAQTSVFGNELIGSTVTLDYSGGQQITGVMVAVPGFPDAAKFVTAQGGGGGTGINFNLNSSPLTNLSIDNNLIQGNSGYGVLFNALLSDIQGTISNNQINAVADDGISFMLVDSNLTGDIVDNAIGANLKNGLSFSPSVAASGEVLKIPSVGQIVVTSFANGLANGDRIVLAGAAGEDFLGVPMFGADNPANGVFLVQNVTADTFELRDPSTNAPVFANSVYKGGGTWFKTPAAGDISGASNPAAGDIEITSAAHGLTTGDVVTVQQVIGNLTANGTHKVTVTGPNTFTLDGVSGVGDYVPGPAGKSGVWYKTFIVDVRGSITGNNINANLGAGINVDLPAGAVFLGDLKKNVIENNRGIGFNLTTTAGSFDLNVGTADPADSNTFDRNVGAGLAVNVLDTGSGSYVVQNNLFTAQQDDPLSSVFVGAGFQTRLEGTLPTVEASSILSVSKINNNTFGVDNLGNAGPGVLFGMGEGTVIDVLDVKNNTFINNRDDGFKYFRRDDADLNSVLVQANTFEGNRGDGVELFAQNTTRDPLDWRVLDNEITNNGEYGIRIRVEADARVRAELTNNTIDFNGSIGIDPNPNSTGTVGGIGLSAFQAVEVEMPLKNNRIRKNFGDGFSVDAINVIDTLRFFGAWSNNTFDGNTANGVRTDGIAFGYSSWLDNTFNDNGLDGVQILNSDDWEVRSILRNQFMRNGDDGLQLGRAVQAIIGDGTVANLNRFESNTGDGLKLTQAQSAYLATDAGVDAIGQTRRRDVITSLNHFLFNGSAGIDADNVGFVRLVVNDSIFFKNQGDGIEWKGTSGSNALTIRNSRFTFNGNPLDPNAQGGRGIDFLEAGGGTTDFSVFDSVISSNAFEGVYVINTADRNQPQERPDDPLTISTDRFGGSLNNPQINFRFRDNIVESNGNSAILATIPLANPTTTATPLLVSTPNLGTNQGTLGGLVVRPGTVDSDGRIGQPVPIEQFLVTSDPNFIPRTQLNGSGIDAEILNNFFDGNFGSEVYFDSFRSTNPPTTRANWNGGDNPVYRVTTLFRDPLSRFDLRFQGNKTNPNNSIDVLNGFAWHNNSEDEFKSRAAASTAPQHVHTNNPLGGHAPLGIRRRNATRTLGNPQRIIVNPPDTGLPPLYFGFDGEGRSTWRVEQGFDIDPNFQTNEVFDFSDFNTSKFLGNSVGELSFNWDTGNLTPGNPSGDTLSLKKSQVFGQIIEPDRFEVNDESTPYSDSDSFISAYDFGLLDSTIDEKNLTVEHGNDDDYFKFKTTDAGGVQIDLFFSAKVGDLDLELYEITPFETQVNTEEKLIASSIISDTNNAQVSANLKANTEYIVRVFGSPSRSMGATDAEFHPGTSNNYRLLIPKVIPFDKFEPNETFDAAADFGTLPAAGIMETGLTIHRAAFNNPGDGFVTEVEGNDTIYTAQDLDEAPWSVATDDNLDIEGFTTPNGKRLNHVTVLATGDDTFDFFKFTVSTPGARAIFDVDFGVTGNADDVNTEIFIFDSSGNIVSQGLNQAINDNDIPRRETSTGSISPADSFLINPFINSSGESFFFNSPGTYFVAVGMFNSTAGILVPPPTAVTLTKGLAGAAPVAGSRYRLTLMIEDHQLGDPGDVDFYKFTAPAALPAPPVTFFSVDIDTDQLVKIDPLSGTVTNVGPIGHDMNNTDLTFLNGKLFAVTPNSPNASTATQWDLVEISPSTGLALSITPLSANGSNPLFVEGLTTRDGKLVIAYDVFDQVSSRLGEVDVATGVITEIVDFQGVTGTNPDFDGIGTNPDGSLFAVDVIPPALGNLNQLTFSELQSDPFAISNSGSFSRINSDVTDMTHDGTNMFAIDSGRSEILTLDPANPSNRLSTVSFASKFNLQGLASDFSAIPAKVAGAVQVEIAAATPADNLELEIFDSNQKLVTSARTPSGNELVAFNYVPGAEYFVRVFAAAQNNSRSYALNIKPVFPDSNDTPLLNDTFDTATDLGSISTSASVANQTIHRLSTLLPPAPVVVTDQETNNLLFNPQNIDNAIWTLAPDANIGDATTPALSPFTPPFVASNTSTTIPHTSIVGTGNSPATFDVYSFTIEGTGTRGIFDIDGTNVDTKLFLFRENNGLFTLLANNENASDFDGAGGSGGLTAGLDPLIDFILPVPDTYYIVVGGKGSAGATGGALTGLALASKDKYTLQVSLEDKSESPGTLTPGDDDFYRFTIPKTPGTTTGFNFTDFANPTTVAADLNLLDAAVAPVSITRFKDKFVPAGGLDPTDPNFPLDVPLDGPVDLAFSPSGNIFVISQQNNAILRFDGTTGAPLPSAGNLGATFVAAGAFGLDAPTGIAFGPDGNADGFKDLYITTNTTRSVLRYDGVTGLPLPAVGQTGAIFAVTDTFIAPNSLDPIDEVEANDTLATAQDLETAFWNLRRDDNISNSLTRPHVSVLGTGDGTFDYYSFTARAGTTATFDIDAENIGFDTTLFLYDSLGNKLAENDGGPSGDPGNGDPSGVPASFLTHTFTADTQLAQVWSNNGAATFNDETVDANDAGNADYAIFDTGVSGDVAYFGLGQTFSSLGFDNANGTQGVGGAGIWEYFNGTIWTALSVTGDTTAGFTAAAADGQVVNFTSPADWAVSPINGSADLYYVRFRATAAYTTAPVYDQVNVTGETARYVIGVAKFPSIGAPGGITGPAPATGDEYTLHVSVDGHTLSDPVFEVEPNSTIATAQSVAAAPFNANEDANIGNSTTVPHISIRGTGDGSFDYYSFTVAAGGTAVFDIDQNNFNTEIFLYDTNGVLLAQNDDAGADPGDGVAGASRLSHTFTSGGTFVIGVGEGPGAVGSAGGITGDAPDAGDRYTLHISIGSPQPQDRLSALTFGPDVTGDGEPDLYVSRRDFNSVIRFNGVTGSPLPSTGNPGSTFVKTGLGGLNNPGELVWRPDGRLYVASRGTNSILRYDASAVFVDRFVGDDPLTLLVDESGGLDDPSGFDFNAAGQLFVSSFNTNSILRYDGVTGAFQTVEVNSGNSGLNGPTSPTFRANGDLFVGSLATNEVFRYGPWDALRLTPPSIDQRGGAWYTKEKQFVSAFDTTFEFRLATDGSEGFAFVIQNSSATALSGGGGSLGFAIPNSIAIEFDTSLNVENNDPDDNHISVQTRKTLANSANHARSLGSVTPNINLNDGEVHTARVEYVPGTMRIYLDDLVIPILSVPLDITTTLNLPDGRAWAGFTAVSGGDAQSTDILSWKFDGIDSVPVTADLTFTNSVVGDLQLELYDSVPGFGPPAAVPFQEDEANNDSVANPQDLDPGIWTKEFNANIGNATDNTSTFIPHLSVQGKGDGNLDYYSFTVGTGESGIFDIDFTGAAFDPAAATPNETEIFDSEIFLFDSTGTQLATNDNTTTLSVGEGGSASLRDAFLEYDFTTDGPGTYIIAVGRSGGKTPDAGEFYTLQVSLSGHEVNPNVPIVNRDLIAESISDTDNESITRSLIPGSEYFVRVFGNVGSIGRNYGLTVTVSLPLFAAPSTRSAASTRSATATNPTGPIVVSASSSEGMNPVIEDDSGLVDPFVDPGTSSQTVADTGNSSVSNTTPITSLTQADLDKMVTVAKTYWEVSGLSAEQSEALSLLTVNLVDMPGFQVGSSSGLRLAIDTDAAGFNWYVDPEPFNTYEFTVKAAQSQYFAEADSAGFDRMDLLTVLLHEMGHTIGMGDLSSTDAPNDLMASVLTPGERRLPLAGQALGTILKNSPGNETHFLAAPVTVDFFANDSIDVNVGDGIVADAGGNKSLRAAIMETNASAGADIISIDAGTVTLTIDGNGEDASVTGDLDITDDLTINGAGIGKTIIDGSAIFDRVFHIQPGAVVTLSNMTITGGSGFFGGGILNEGSLVLNNVDVVDNFTSTTVDSFTADTVDANVGDGLVADAAGNKSLRAAIMEANSTTAADVINVNAGTVLLTIDGDGENLSAQGDLDISENLTINGAGIGKTIIDGSAIFDRIFHVQPNATVTLSNMTITKGSAVFAGGILNEGTLILDNVEVIDNFSTSRGGGIYNAGTLSVNESTIANNHAESRGGGLFNNGTASLATISNSTFSTNTAGSRGGAIFNEGMVGLSNSTISQGSSNSSGGGVFNEGTLNLTNATVVKNTTDVNGGGILNDTSAVVNIQNTIVALNTADPALAAGNDLSGFFKSLGGNFIGDGVGSVGIDDGVDRNQVGGGFVAVINPDLLPLGDYGGPTLTHIPNLGSPVRDAGLNKAATATDQRGLSRLVDGDNQTDVVIDIGSVEASLFSLPGRIWQDTNSDGIQNNSEPGIPATQVRLFDAGADQAVGGGDDTLLNTVTTDSLGRYVFPDLFVGTYFVEAALVPGHIFSPQDRGSDESLDSDVNTATGRSNAIVLTGGSSDRSLDAGMIPLASAVSNFAFVDTNGNGIQDSGEPGRQGVTVQLFSAGPNGAVGGGDDTLIGTKVTDSNGLSEFTNLSAGNFYLTFSTPAGLAFTVMDQGSDDTLDSDVNPFTRRTDVFAVIAGQVDDSRDAGFVPESTIGDFVFGDIITVNGIQDLGEPGAIGIAIELFEAGADGLIGGGDDVSIGTTVSGSGGAYQFSGLAAGNYYLSFTKPAGLVFTTQDSGPDTVDSDVDPATLKTAVFALGSGVNDTTRDAGLVPQAKVGDFVWKDTNRNGVQDVGESGIIGLQVQIFSPGTDGQIGGGDDVLIGTTNTDSNGAYEFATLDPGKYYLEYAEPADLDFTIQDAAGSSDALDSDVNPATNQTALFTLTIGQDDQSHDAGLVNETQVGDRVWEDANQDGIQQVNETDVSGVTVRLFSAGPDSQIGGGDDLLIGTKVTDSNGIYRFVELKPGEYYLEFDNPAGFSFSPKDQGGVDLQDSDVTPLTGRTDVFALIPGQFDQSRDAGLVPGANVGNFVWRDLNADGIQQKSEPGFAGVSVSLLNVGADGQIGGGDDTLAKTTTTDGSGFYEFRDISPGTFYVQINDPAGFIFTLADKGSDDALDSDVDFSGLSHDFVLTPGQTEDTIDAGLIVQTDARVGNLVFNDLNSDGIQQPSEFGLAGVKVEIFATGADGQIGGGDDTLLKSIFTNANGRYSFTNLAPARYYIGFEEPVGFDFTLKDQGSNDLIDSDVSRLSGFSDPFTLASGENNQTIDAGMLVLPQAPGVPVLTGPTLEDSETRPTVTWNPVAGATSFDLLLYSKRLGQQVLSETGIVGNAFQVPRDLPPDEYQVFVRSTNLFGNSGFSAPRNFKVTGSKPSRPILTNPPPTTIDSTPTIAWTNAAGAASYELLVYNVATGQAVINQKNITTTQFTPTNQLPASQYQAFVRAVNALGTSSYSPARFFSVLGTVLGTPTLTGPPSTTNDARPNITWTSVVTATSYELLVYNVDTGQEVVNQKNLSTTNFKPTTALASATHQAFVRAVNGLTIGSYSSPLQFVVTAGAAGAAGTPTLFAPATTTNDNTPTFKWTGVTGATSYELLVYNRDAGQEVINVTNISATEFTQPSNLPNGRYQAFVRSQTPSGPSSYSAPLNFEIVSSASKIVNDHNVPALQGLHDFPVNGQEFQLAGLFDQISILTTDVAVATDAMDSETLSPWNEPLWNEGDATVVREYGWRTADVADGSITNAAAAVELDAVLTEWPELDWWSEAGETVSEAALPRETVTVDDDDISSQSAEQIAIASVMMALGTQRIIETEKPKPATATTKRLRRKRR